MGREWVSIRNRGTILPDLKVVYGTGRDAAWDGGIPIHQDVGVVGLHDDGRRVDVGLDALMGQDAAAIDIDLIADGNVVAENRHILKTGPLANDAIPAHDGALDPSMILHFGARQQHTALQADTVTHDNIRADGDVGSYSAVLAELGRRVDQHIAAVHVGQRGRSELLGAPLREGRQVKAGACQEVLRLANIHPEALQVERVQLPILDHGRECLLFDRGRPELDAVQNRCVENVDTGIDAVADELDWLFYEAVDAGCMAGLVDDDTILGWLLDLGDNDGAFVAV